MELSDRLLSVAKLVLPAKTLADVGCDHGYLSVYLINEKKCEHVIAMDVRKGPLARAEQTIRTYGMEPYIELRLSDGLKKLDFGEADGYVCAGMGGRLALQIMWQDRFKVAAMKQVILQPQSELWLVRRMLKKWGCVIAEERMVCDEGKFYPMMRMIPGEGFAEAKEVEEGSFLDCFTEDNWAGIYRDIRDYFPEYQIVGWFLGGPGFLLEDTDRQKKIQEDNFGGGDKIFLKMDCRVICQFWGRFYQKAFSRIFFLTTFNCSIGIFR